MKKPPKSPREIGALLDACFWIIRLGSQCPHPLNQRIKILSGPGSWACGRCLHEHIPVA